jgi:hypothetical protein
MNILVVSITLALAASAAIADLPPLYDFRAYTAATEQVSLLCVPDGSGRPLTEAMTSWGGVIDASITVEMFDAYGDPIVGYPAEDVWLETTMGSMSVCPAGSIADGPSDVNGQLFMTGVLYAGGCSDILSGEEISAFVNGMPIWGNEMDILINSPDLNADLVVNLSDVVLFSQLFLSGVYDYAADLHYDGILNLSDLVVIAQHRNTMCP